MRAGENSPRSETQPLRTPDYVPDWLSRESEQEYFTQVCERLMELGVNSAGSHVFLDAYGGKSDSLFVHAYPAGDRQASNLRLILKQNDWHNSVSATYDYLIDLENEAMTCARSNEYLPPIGADGVTRQLKMNSASAPAIIRSANEVVVYYGRDYADLFDASSLEPGSGGVLAGQLAEQLRPFDNQNRLEADAVHFRAVS